MDIGDLVVPTLVGLGGGLAAYLRARYENRELQKKFDECDSIRTRLQQDCANLKAADEASRDRIAVLEGSVNTLVKIVGHDFHAG